MLSRGDVPEIAIIREVRLRNVVNGRCVCYFGPGFPDKALIWAPIWHSVAAEPQ